MNNLRVYEEIIIHKRLLTNYYYYLVLKKKKFRFENEKSKILFYEVK